MQTSYIYSVSRANALSDSLLSKTDIDRLLVAEPGEDIQSALKETYLAPYIVRAPNEDMSLAIEQTLIEAKKTIHRISPKGDMFRVLWIQYDIHNLRVFAKATANNLSFEECKTFVSERGVYDPVYLYSCAEAGTLALLQAEWQVSYSKAVQTISNGEISEVDGIFDELYFTTSKRIVASIKDTFMHTYLQTLIDLYNLKSRLRHLKNQSVSFHPKFVDGGTFGPHLVETLDETLGMFGRIGGSGYWSEALEFYQESGNFTLIDAKSADYLMITARQGSYDMFSSASLVMYYLKCRQAAANVRIIVVGKNSGTKESAIRANLRMAYVNE